VLRLLLWRLIGLLAAVVCSISIAWLLGGGPGRELRGPAKTPGLDGAAADLGRVLDRAILPTWTGAPYRSASSSGRLLIGIAPLALGASLFLLVRWRGRRRRRYVRLVVHAYRGDHATAEAIAAMFAALHKRLLQRWWRRVLTGQPAVALEVHHGPEPPGADVRPESEGAMLAWLAICCPQGWERMVESALRVAYPNCRLGAVHPAVDPPPVVLRLKKSGAFIRRAKVLDRLEHEREPPVNRLITAMAACGEPAFVQVAATPTPASFERLARYLYRRHELRLARERRERMTDRSVIGDSELRGALELQHKPLFFVDLRVIAARRTGCEQIAAELRSESAENHLVERGTAIRQGLFGAYSPRVKRGEGNPLPGLRRGVFAAGELAALWHLPSGDYATVPFPRAALPQAPAPPAIMRPASGAGTLRDALGAVSIHPQLRKQNTAVPGAVEQGKSSYLVASVAEDLSRERCAVIVLDPKGDAADAAVSLVPPGRTCTLLDLARPVCGFNPLAVDAPADVIADYVVAALKNLFTDADIRASSDRYLRNAIIAVLAFDRASTLWDAARLLSVGEEGYSYRRDVGARIRALPEFKEISAFFTAELSAQLADARSVTTAKLDAPVNKLARLLNSPSIKRVLLNESLRVDFDGVIAGREVLVVKGALGAMGAGNTSVLMQLLVGMLDAALARQQDLLPAPERVAVALKVDEAPIVLNRGFTETMALKRSAGLETVACWQTDAQWVDMEVRDQLDALFAHRVYFATASARDARRSVELTMAEYSDTVRPGVERLSALGHPDVRLHLPKHHAIATWVTPEGRQSPFVAETVPMEIDRERIALHAARQRERGGRHLTDLRQPHWERSHHQPASQGQPASARPLAREAGVSDRSPRSAGGSRPAQTSGPVSPARAAAPGAARAGVGREALPAPRAASAGDLPAAPAESYRELAELDRAYSVRWAPPVTSPGRLHPDPLDMEILALVARLGHVLSSQLHRRFNPRRAATTTQRRLKRLADAGLLERFQFHRRDGGGVPMCYVATDVAMRMLGLEEEPAGGGRAARDGPRPRATVSDEARRLRRARHELHVGGWALAFSQLMGVERCALRGRSEAVLVPPARSTPEGKAPFAPADLRLPGGRVPHDFLRADASGEPSEVDRFETVRPDGIVEVAREGAGGPRTTDVVVELDDRLAHGGWAAKLERYDHFLAGWSVHTARYGRRREAEPAVVFLCRDRSRARECGRRADALLRACRAYAGEYPFDWEYPGRERISFASERDVHEGLLLAFRVPALPPAVRIAAAQGDPSVGEVRAEPVELLGAPPAR
jgi:Replication-relaxation